MVTKEQIKARLKALNDYELSLISNRHDDPDRITDELTKILVAKSKLRGMET